MVRCGELEKEIAFIDLRVVARKNVIEYVHAYLQTVFSSSSAQFKRASIGRPSREATRMGHRANFMEFLRTEITKRTGGSR